MSDTENVAPCSPLPRGIGYFEVKGTPPDERKRRERMTNLAAAQEAGILLLTPFAASPRLEFDRIKLGQYGVRRLIVRNPGDKALEVRLEKLPKEEKGFNVDYVAFRLGGREETTLMVGWTPVKGGGVRDSFIVKFGKFSAQVILIGSCLAPEEKKVVRGAPKPRPLAPKNSNGKRPTLSSSKLHAPAPKIPIPLNPVVRKNNSPEKHLMEGMSPPKEQPQAQARVQSDEVKYVNRQQDFVCGGEVQSLEISRAEVLAYDLRRETYVHERPQPRGGDVISSTPIQAPRDLSTQEFLPPDLRRQTYIPESSQKLFGLEADMGAMLPPPDPRRQTYIPEKRCSASNLLQLPTVLPQNGRTMKRSPGKSKLTPVDEAAVPVAESWTPQKPWETEKVERKTWESGKQLEPAVATPNISGVESLQLEVGELSLEEAQDLSLSPKKAIIQDKYGKKEPELSAVLAKLMSASMSEPLNLSLKNKERILDTPTPTLDLSNAESEMVVKETSNMPATPSTPARYMPRVSDISQATDVASPSPNLAIGHPVLAVNSLPLRDIRLQQLMQDEDETKGALDLSTGSVLADCSMAVHLTTPAKGREDDVDQELADVDEQAASWEEEELEQLAMARATSAAADRTDDFGAALVEVEQSEWRLVEEQEICTTEVVEEVVEYEFQIIDGQRRLVGERKVGGTVSSQREVTTRTPVKTLRHMTRTIQSSDIAAFQPSPGAEHAKEGPAANIMEMEKEEPEFINIPLSVTSDPKMRPRLVDLTAEQCAVPSHPVQSDHFLGVLEEDLVNPVQVSSHVLLDGDLGLPGLRGSPRLSHQMASGRSFLQTTIGESSFLPPDPEDPRRCSTGVKTKGGPLIGSPTEEVRKSLQFVDSAQNSEAEEEEVMAGGEDPAGMQDKSNQFAPVNSLGFQLPIIKTQEEEEENCRLSSDTFITSPAPPALSVIQEERSSQIAVSRSQLGSESIQQKEGETFTEKRTPARPRRSTISYTTQNIADIASSDEKIKEEKCLGEEASGGLMFFPISPDQSKGEKRKSDEGMGNRVAQEKKRIRAPEPKTLAAKAPVVVRAAKNPAPPRPVRAMNNSQFTRTGPRGNTKDTKAQSMPAKRTVSKVPSQPMRRLQLGSKKNSLIHRPNPFASRNMYYDDKWVEKQERGFTRWLNFMLTPQSLEEETSMVPGAVDVAKLWSQCTKDVRVPRAPTREVLSLRAYTARREMNRLRRNACKLWQSSQVASVVSRLELEIDKLRLVIRKDRNFNRDVGMKQKLLQLLLSYNPLWLRIGLETVYGELVSLGNNSDVLGLSRFLVTRLLSNPEILAEWAHPSVPHSYRDGHQEALNRFALKKFLELVYFLDAAKEARMIRMNPCLFCPDSELKSSREMLLTFSKEFLQGEGDVTKHLAYMGYTVMHKQTKLDEFDYAVTNFRTDMRCGLRLARVAELLTGSVLSAQMRVPAISRTQKVHNTEVAVTAFKAGGYDVPSSITAKDLVDGHQEKSLQFLWSIIFGHSLSQVLDVNKLKEEIVHLRRSLRARAGLGEAVALAGQKWLQEMALRSPGQKRGLELGETVSLLLQWAQLVTAHHGVHVENWTVSWADGRGLCLLVNHYQPTLLDAAEIQQQTTLTHQADEENLDDSLDFNYGSQKVDCNSYNVFLENEKANFKLLITKVTELGGVPILIKAGDMSNTIPDEKVTATFVGYLAARLLDLSREIKAARVIQLAWRRIAAIRREERLKVQTAAARKIQWCVRQFLGRRRVERYNAAALVLQAAFRGALGRRRAREQRWMKREEQILASVLLCQSVWRGVRARRQVERRKHAIVALQAAVRGWMVRRRQREMKEAAIALQRRWRATLEGRRVRQVAAEKERACVVLQTAVRTLLCVRRFKRLKRITVMLQAWIRMVRERRHFLKLRSCVVFCQGRARAMAEGRKMRTELHEKKVAAIKVQSWVRMVQARKQFLKISRAVLIVQTFARGALLRRQESRKQEAARSIQVWWRALVSGRQQRKIYLKSRAGVVLLQSLVRAGQQRSRYLALQNAVLNMQRRRRLAVQGRRERAQFVQMRSAAVVLQARWRGLQARRAHACVIDILVTLQARVKGLVVRRRYTALRRAACTLQRQWRSRQLGMVQRTKFLEQKKAAVTLQSTWKMERERRRFKKDVERVVKCQAVVKSFLQRRSFLKIRAAAVIIQERFRGFLEMKRLSYSLNIQREAALKAQTWWRMKRERASFLLYKQSVIICQASVRGYLARRSYSEKCVAVALLQTRMKEFLEMRRARSGFLAKKLAAVKLQSWWRMVQQRKKHRADVANVILLQAHIRGLVERKGFLRLKKAARVVQKRFRATQEMRMQRASFLRLQRSALAIQSQYRMMRTQRQYKDKIAKVIKCQSVIKAFLFRQQYLEIKASASLIQQRFREFKAMRGEREDFLKKKAAALSVQSWWRMIKQRREYREEVSKVVKCQALVRQRLQRQSYLKMKMANLFLQKRFRECRQMRKERQNFLDKKAAAVHLQSWWRMKKQQKLYNEEVSKVVTCQAVIRGFLDRRCYLIIRNAALVIQQRFRDCRVARKERQIYLAKKSAALKLQSWIRMTKQRWEYQEEVRKVVKCQATIRQVLQRERFLKMRSAAIVIQERFGDYQKMTKSRHAFLEKKQAAVKLQSHWRMLRQRRAFKEELVAVVKCQALVKAKMQRQTFLRMKRATVLIQQRFRDHKMMLKERADFLEIRWAATVLQSNWRATKQRRIYKEDVRKVVICQAVARGYLAKRHYLQMTRAVLVIQQRYRDSRQVKMERERFLRRKSATLQIQSWWRMARARQQFFTILRAAIVCQATMRAFIDRQRFLKMKEASKVIQERWRATRKAQATRSDYVKLRIATVTLQARWRGRQAREQYRMEVEKVVRCQALVRGKLQRNSFIESKKAACLIQERFRDFVQMRKIREAFLVNRSAALLLQAWWRMAVQRREYLSLRSAAVTCQSALRMVRERKRFTETKAATIFIQRHWRSRKEVELAGQQFVAVKKAVRLIQAHVRGRQVRERYLQQKAAAMLIQRQLRGWRGRKKAKALKEERRREVAVTKLQAWLKGCLERKRYTSVVKSCIAIQRWRCSLCQARIQHQKYLQLRSAAIVVQSRRRGAIVRRTFLRQRSATVVIQSLVRRQQAYASFVRMKTASVILQRWWRAGKEMRKHRDCLAALKQATITTQRLWRGRIVRIEQQRRRDATTLLQAHVRGWLARKWVARKREALVAMQRAARRMAEARRERARFLQIKNTVVGLQAQARGLQARRSFARLLEDKEYREQLRREEMEREEARREAASHVVVRTVRTLIVRRRFLRLKAAATTVQSAWRGRQGRIELRNTWKLMASRLRQLQDVRAKLEAATKAAKPEQRLGVRTHSAIAYIFDIHDVAQLISAVKTLDMATRLSLYCCRQMAGGEGSNTPVAALVSLLKRCNRSVPHMEVVSTTLDILLNLARVEETRSAVASVPDLLPDLLQAMLVYRDNGKDIFPKCCAVLQTLACSPEVLSSLRSHVHAKTLVSHESLVIKKNKKKEESKRRSSVNLHSMPAPLSSSGRKPLRTLNSSQLNRTYTAPTGAVRKNSTSLASGPPWNGTKDLPRHHEDPVKAILALNKIVGIASNE